MKNLQQGDTSLKKLWECAQVTEWTGIAGSTMRVGREGGLLLPLGTKIGGLHEDLAIE